SSLVVVSGHAESAYSPVLDGLPPGGATVVVLMGMASRARIASRLASSGWAARTPSAVLLSAGTPEAWSWRGTLAELGIMEVPDTHRAAPGVLVIGEVAALADAIGAAATVNPMVRERKAS